MHQPTIAFIGAGNMGRSLAGGLLKSGWDRKRLLLADPDVNQQQAVSEVLGVSVSGDNREVVERADIVVLAVKPQTARAVAEGIAESTQKKQPLIVSIAAGVRIADLERWLGGRLAIIRVMPNTPALVGSGASALYANERVQPAHRDLAESILRTVGVTVWLSREDLLDVVTALSGSGPAYFFLVMEVLEQAAIDHGLDPPTARLLTLETAFGAAKMALEGDAEPAELRRRVTSPGGTTERAIQVLQEGNVALLFSGAIEAATARSRELGDLLGEK